MKYKNTKKKEQDRNSPLAEMQHLLEGVELDTRHLYGNSVRLYFYSKDADGFYGDPAPRKAKRFFEMIRKIKNGETESPDEN